MENLRLDLSKIERFTVVQVGECDQAGNPICDEKEFTKILPALDLLKKSEAPAKWLEFNLEGFQYKLYPTTETEEFLVDYQPILN